MFEIITDFTKAVSLSIERLFRTSSLSMIPNIFYSKHEWLNFTQKKFFFQIKP